MDGLPYRNEYVEIEPDPDHHVVVFRRTASPLPDSEQELRALYEHIARVFDELPLEQWGLLVDGRAPRGRNDEVFERIQREYRPRLFGRFGRVAALVRTSVGALQVDRYIRHETDTFAVFGDERDARAFLHPTD